MLAFLLPCLSAVLAQTNGSIDYVGTKFNPRQCAKGVKLFYEIGYSPIPSYYRSALSQNACYTCYYCSAFFEEYQVLLLATISAAFLRHTEHCFLAPVTITGIASPKVQKVRLSQQDLRQVLRVNHRNATATCNSWATQYGVIPFEINGMVRISIIAGGNMLASRATITFCHTTQTSAVSQQTLTFSV
jgi:hypothetical protein